jgi:hypothetical protein
LETDTQVQATEWLKLGDGAPVAGVGRSTLDRAATAGEVPFAVIGGIRFFQRDDLVEWRAARTNGDCDG